MDAITQFLPQDSGLLPKWLLLVGITSFFNTISCFRTPLPYARALYSTAPPTEVSALSARTFGTWTLLTGCIRLYAAYHIREPSVYLITFMTFVSALAHFGSEAAYFGTVRLSGRAVAPVVVASGSVLYMLVQWGNYRESAVV